MADFLIALDHTLKNEGLYSNDPADTGGETALGISRRHWPGAQVWPIVDAAKQLPDFPNSLRKNLQLLQLVQDFYRRNFWHIDFTSLHSQDLATWLFDKRVNMGITQPVKFLQRALQLVDDGKFGPLTLNAANNYPEPSKLLEDCREQAREYYRRIVENKPSQARFLNGWMARV